MHFYTKKDKKDANNPSQDFLRLMLLYKDVGNYSSAFFFRLNILVRSMKTVSAAQKTTRMPKVIHVAFMLLGA